MLSLKEDFPIFENNKDLVYLDSAATSQRPKKVIDAIVKFYEHDNASANKGVYTLSESATLQFDAARKSIAQFIGAKSEEVVFTKNATEGLNFLSHSILPILPEGRKEIVLTEMEHHSNLVPWQQFAKTYGFTLKFIKIKEDFTLDYQDAKRIITENTALVSLTHVSNVLGTINDVSEIVSYAKDIGAMTVVDAAQSVVHGIVDVSEMNCDFLVFSSHKMLGPTGIGVLYGKKEHLDKMEPLFFGGGMVDEVTYEKASWVETPYKFEAGTQNYSGAISLSATVDYILSIGKEKISEHIHSLVSYALEKLQDIKGVEVYSPKQELNAGIISFTVDGIHAHDIASILNESNVAIRAGHLCAMPLLKRLSVEAICRASFSVYTTNEDIDALVSGIKKTQEVFSK